jgi:hypothetical protein
MFVLVFLELVDIQRLFEAHVQEGHFFADKAAVLPYLQQMEAQFFIN